MKKKNKKVNAAILIIGNEILSGRTQDKNIAFISNWLNSKCGISVNEVRIVPDLEKTIIRNLLELSKKYSASEIVNIIRLFNDVNKKDLYKYVLKIRQDG